MNQAYLCIFDANYDSAIQFFRQVNTIKPANIVAANNLATCKIFLNKVGESIKTLEGLIKSDPENKLNEQVIQNIISMYEIWYAHNPKDKKQILNEFILKQGKDSAVAYVQMQQQASIVAKQNAAKKPVK